MIIGGHSVTYYLFLYKKKKVDFDNPHPLKGTLAEGYIIYINLSF